MLHSFSEGLVPIHMYGYNIMQVRTCTCTLFTFCCVVTIVVENLSCSISHQLSLVALKSIEILKQH